MKKLSVFLITICLITAGTVPAFAAQDRNAAYTDILTQQTLSQTAGNVVMLRDLDLDGVPELFFGYDAMGISPVKSAWTYKNGSVQKITVPENTSDLSVSNIKQAALYYNKNLNEFRIFSPAVYTHNGAGTDTWSRLIYDGKSLKNGSDIYSITWSAEKYSADGMPIKTEESWKFGNTVMDSSTFTARLKSFYSGWLCVDTATLTADNSGTSYSSTMPDVSGISLWTTDSTTGDYKWDAQAVEKFMKQWTPTVVVGTHKASANTMSLSVNGASMQAPAYLLFGNNYIKLRDLASCLQNTEHSFDVTWNGQAVQIKSGSTYKDGTKSDIADMQQTADAVYSKQAIYFDGSETALTAYLINGNNYVRLRDAGVLLGFSVDWDNAARVVKIK